MVAGDERLVSSAKTVNIGFVGWAAGFRVPVVAAGTGEYEIPDTVDRRSANDAAGGPGEEVIYVADFG